MDLPTRYFILKRSIGEVTGLDDMTLHVLVAAASCLVLVRAAGLKRRQAFLAVCLVGAVNEGLDALGPHVRPAAMLVDFSATLVGAALAVVLSLVWRSRTLQPRGRGARSRRTAREIADGRRVA